MRMRTFLPGSIQSKLTGRVRVSEATTWASRKAISRTSLGSGPLTRYCTGQPTGGPSSRGTIRVTAPGKSSASTRSSLARNALARVDVLCDDDELTEEIVGQLH